MTPLSASLAIIGLLFTIASAHADPIYCWHDVDQQLHCSNRVERVPPGAKVASPPPLGYLSTRRIQPTTPKATTGSRPSRDRRGCGPADATGVAEAIAERIGGRSDLVLLVGGVPTPVEETYWSTTFVEGGDRPWSELEQGSVAYPALMGCPDRPPLPRYPVRSRGSRNGLCGDYQRALAQIGTAVSRNSSIPLAFGEIADKYEAIARNGNVTFGEPAEVQALAVVSNRAASYGFQWAIDEIPSVELPEWLVEAHAAQTRELGDETDVFVYELTIALEEIDRAARAAGCW